MAHNLLYININADYYARWWGNQIFIGISIKKYLDVVKIQYIHVVRNILNYRNYIFKY